MPNLNYQSFHLLKRLSELLMRMKVKRHAHLLCHSGLSGIFLCFQKDSRRALLAGITKYEALLMNSLVNHRNNVVVHLSRMWFEAKFRAIGSQNGVNDPVVVVKSGRTAENSKAFLV